MGEEAAGESAKEALRLLRLRADDNADGDVAFVRGLEADRDPGVGSQLAFYLRFSIDNKSAVLRRFTEKRAIYDNCAGGRSVIVPETNS